MEIEFKMLAGVDKFDIIELMNNPLVRRQMPLAVGNFGIAEVEKFVALKEALWNEYGYGPWAFIVDGIFAGWGGLQPESGCPDLGLVLHPNYWGLGRVLYKEIMSRAFGEMGFDTVTVLLPPTRKKIKGLLRLGFREDGEFKVDGEIFIRYVIKKIN
jgi:[ribosomal protein S5]-alanine N-acetyltransferase